MTEASQEMIGRLDKLLDKERQTLLSGRMTQMSKLLQEKEALLQKMSDQAVSAPIDVAHIREKVLRNQELLDSALAGIQTVANRIAALRQARMSLETYDKAGSKTEIKTPVASSVEKRA